MKQLTELELLELYVDTLEKCGVFLLNEDDETIKYNIYEEFDIGVHSFLHMDNLRRLYKGGLISLEKLNRSRVLYDKVIALQDSEEWGIKSFRTSERWREVMNLSDEIRAIH